MADFSAINPNFRNSFAFSLHSVYFPYVNRESCLQVVMFRHLYSDFNLRPEISNFTKPYKLFYLTLRGNGGFSSNLCSDSYVLTLFFWNVNPPTRKVVVSLYSLVISLMTPIISEYFPFSNIEINKFFFCSYL